jgi:hypothetical protein
VTAGGVAHSIRGLMGVPAKDASVRVGNFCSDEGAIGQTSDGKQATCTRKSGKGQTYTCAKKSGEQQARWRQ